MLSSLPKLTSKSFLIGQFMPAMVFLISMSGVIYGLSYAHELLKTASDSSNIKSIILLIATATCLSIITVSINDDIYKLYEGYHFPLNKARFLVKWKITRRNKINTAIEDIYSELAEPNIDKSRAKKLGAQAEDLLFTRRNSYPRYEADILPTAFGNAIRSFEDYPREVYGADSVIIWPRLSSISSKELISAIETARSHVDLFLNLSIYCFVGFILITANYTLWIGETKLGLYLPFWQSWETSHLAAGAGGFLSLIAGFLFYRMAVKRVAPWGNQVRTVFDLHLPDLAKRLGYRMPEGADGRKEMWGQIGRQFAYHTPVDPSKWESEVAGEPSKPRTRRRVPPTQPT